MSRFEKIRELIHESMREDLVVTPESTLEDLEMDSLDVAEIVIEIEDAYDITIESYNDVHTVQDLMNLIP